MSSPSREISAKNSQGAAIGFPISPVIANIYMEYFEEIALGLKCPFPTLWLKGYVDDVISIVKKVDAIFSHLNYVELHIKFTMEAPDIDVSISFLATKCSPNSYYSTHTSVYRKPNHTNHCLDWNCNHPISANKAVIHALIYRAKNVPFLKFCIKKWTSSIEFFTKKLPKLDDQRN